MTNADRNLKYTIATHAAEYMKPSKEAVRLCKEIAKGKTTSDMAINKIMQKHGIEPKLRHVR